MITQLDENHTVPAARASVKIATRRVFSAILLSPLTMLMLSENFEAISMHAHIWRFIRFGKNFQLAKLCER